MTHEIKTFEDACKVKGLDPLALPEVSMLPVEHQNALVATYKLFVVTEALNEGWKPNWNDSDEEKYFPFFLVDADEEHTGGTGLSYIDYDYRFQFSFVGSRLCFQNSELAKYAGTQFADLYTLAHLYL